MPLTLSSKLHHFRDCCVFIVPQAGRIPMKPFPTVSAFFLVALTAAPASDWPEWRGPEGQGLSRATDVPTVWSEERGLAWKTPLPGRGHSTPVVAGGVVWVTTALEVPATAEETAQRLKENTGDQPLTVLSSVSLRAVACELSSGRILHDVELLNVKAPQWVHQLNSYASPSPVMREGRLYAHFGSLGTACLDTAKAEVLWRNTELQVMHENGPGSSPVLWQNRLIVHFDGSDKQFIAAYDTDTGKLAWQTPRSGAMDPRPQQKKAYATPLIVRMNGHDTVVSPAADWVYGYSPADGRELWKQPYGELGFSMSVKPVADERRIYISTCFGKSQLIALEYAGRGTPEVVWRNTKNAPKMSSPVLSDGLIYFVDEGGIVSCLDSASGETVYRERLAGKFSASPVLAGGRLYFASREGRVYVIPEGKTFRVEATNRIDGSIMASPVPLNGSLLLRTGEHLYLAGGAAAQTGR